MTVVELYENNTDARHKEVHFWLFTEGDYDRVYVRLVLMGTWSQVKRYVKENFTSEELERAEYEEFGNDGFAILVSHERYEKPDYWDEEVRGEFDSNVGYSITCDKLVSHNLYKRFIRDSQTAYRLGGEIIDLTYI